MKKQYQLFATTPKGVELLLKDELLSLGALNVAEKLAGVTFTGDLSVAYRACLWSRFANRILLELAIKPTETPEQLYNAVQSIEWDQHLTPDTTFSVQFVSVQSEINHTLFGAQKVKDAIVDQFRDQYGRRPSVSKDKPQVAVYVYLLRNNATIYLDLSGESLHKRGYRLEAGDAPLKENLAAAILQRAGWQSISQQQGTLVDPMCGSGTLLIEAALMAADIAPGLLHDYFGFIGWKQHQAGLWQSLLDEARQKREAGLCQLPIMIGYDHDPAMAHIASANIARANLQDYVTVSTQALSDLVPPINSKPGLIVTNPPYGERLGEINQLKLVYALLAERLKQGFSGWQAAVFTGNPDLGIEMRMRADKMYSLYNGAIACKLLLFKKIYAGRGREAIG